MSQPSKHSQPTTVPPDLNEQMITETPPSVAATAVGRRLSGLYQLPYSVARIIQQSAKIPGPVKACAQTILAPLLFLFVLFFGALTLIVILPLFFLNQVRRYTLTSRRVCVRNALTGKVRSSVELSGLEDVRVVQRRGQAFYRAADLELITGGSVALTLPGVPNAEAFQHNIIAARDALMSVAECQQAQEQETVGLPG